MTLQQLLAECSARLDQAGLAFGHGTLNAHDEAAWLLLWQLRLPLDSDTQAIGNRRLSDSDVQAVRALIGRRIEGRQPAAYLTREAWLQGVPFYVDERAIVPRSLIAEPLASGAFDAWLGEHTRQVLDLCTGNGSLAVLAAMAWPEVQVTGADISTDALAVARINVERHDLADRITLLASDGLAQVDGRFDLVLCNPPYVNAQSMQALPAEYRAEPALALHGGADGMDFVRRLLRELPARLANNGVLVLEIGNERAHFESAFPDLEPVWLTTSAGDDQVLLLTADALAGSQAPNPAPT